MQVRASNIVFILCLLQSESMVLETAENVNNGNPSPLEALLAGAEGFPPMLDIPPDADDETMVELAIALSLQQDQQGKTLLLLWTSLQLTSCVRQQRKPLRRCAPVFLFVCFLLGWLLLLRMSF